MHWNSNRHNYYPYPILYLYRCFWKNTCLAERHFLFPCGWHCVFCGISFIFKRIHSVLFMDCFHLINRSCHTVYNVYFCSALSALIPRPYLEEIRTYPIKIPSQPKLRGILFYSLSFSGSFSVSCGLFDQILNNDKIGNITPPMIFPSTHINRYATAFHV